MNMTVTLMELGAAMRGKNVAGDSTLGWEPGEGLWGTKDENELWKLEGGAFQVEERASDKALRGFPTHKGAQDVWSTLSEGQKEEGWTIMPGGAGGSAGFYLSAMGGY